MASFIRKNLVTISSQFIPPGYCAYVDGVAQPPPPQPSTVEVVLLFRAPGGASVTGTYPMTLQADGITWLYLWDSSLTGGGIVSYVVYASGAVQAADQGQFTILANQANTF